MRLSTTQTHPSAPRLAAVPLSAALVAVMMLAAFSPTQAKPRHPSLEHRLDALAHLAASGPPGAALSYALDHGIKMRGAAVQVVALPWPGLTSDSIDWRGLAARGAAVDAASDFGLRLLVRPEDLSAVADEPTIAFIRPPLSAVPAVVSEGVALTGANDLHLAGITGAGVTVAVIDLGFIGLADAIAAGEIPATAETFDYAGSGMESGTEHGAAVGEVVHDMAPGAHLLLMKVDDEFDLEQAKNEALSLGARVANHSVAWVNSSYYDDTGPISAVANDARANGLLWCNSAGNEAQRHWQGVFVDGDADQWHEFSGGDEMNALASGGSTRYVFLTWDDWPASDQDFDLYLIDKNGNVAASSTSYQNGAQEPTEAIVAWLPNARAPYRVMVYAYDVTEPMEIELFSFDHDFQYWVADGSLMDPASASGATTVGAIRVADYATGPIEYFSSRGPTNDGRTKPDLSAPDGNVSWTYGTFYGTSSASPHVAGAAALLLQQDSYLTADQLHAKLEADAIDMGVSGKDNTYGAGRLHLVINVPPACTVAAAPDPVDCGTSTVVSVVATDPDGAVVAYDVDYGDDTTHGASAVADHTYALGGTYTITAIVTDDGGATASCATTVVVNNLPPACSITYGPAAPAAGEVISLHANASDPCGEVIAGTWDFGDGAVAAGLDVTHTYVDPGLYHACVTVTDDQSAEATCCVDVLVHGGEMVCWTLPGPCWHMITIPCQPVDPQPESVFRDSLGAPIPISGNLHRYDHDGLQYMTYWSHSPSEFGLIEPGDGYWLYLFEPTTICYEATCPASPPSQSFATAGWYLMGMPVAVDVGADEPWWYQGGSGPEALSSISNVWVQDPLVSYDCGVAGYVTHGALPTDESGILPAFRAFWLYTFIDDVTMVVPPS